MLRPEHAYLTLSSRKTPLVSGPIWYASPYIACGTGTNPIRFISHLVIFLPENSWFSSFVFGTCSNPNSSLAWMLKVLIVFMNEVTKWRGWRKGSKGVPSKEIISKLCKWESSTTRQWQNCIIGLGHPTTHPNNNHWLLSSIIINKNKNKSFYLMPNESPLNTQHNNNNNRTVMWNVQKQREWFNATWTICVKHFSVIFHPLKQWECLHFSYCKTSPKFEHYTHTILKLTIGIFPRLLGELGGELCHFPPPFWCSKGWWCKINKSGPNEEGRPHGGCVCVCVLGLFTSCSFGFDVMELVDSLSFPIKWPYNFFIY